MERPLYCGPPRLYPHTPAALTSALAILLAACTHAQTAPPTLQTRQPRNQRLTLDAILPGASGTPANGLAPANLHLRIDGKPVPTAELSIAPEQPQVVFVLDAINTPRGDLVRSRQALLDWLHGAGERLPFEASVLLLTDTAPRFKALAAEQARNSASTWELLKNELYVARLAPTRNPAELATKLGAYEPGLPRLDTPTQIGGSERVHLSLQALSFFAAAMKDSPVAKLVLWLGPGWPFVHMNEGGFSGQVFDSIVYFDDALRDARILLYALDPSGAATGHTAPSEGVPLATRPGMGQNSGSLRPPAPSGSDFYKNFLEPVRSARTADPNTMALPVLAVHSGGTVQVGSNDILGGITRFAADAASVYSLTLPVPDSLKPTGQDTFHTLQLDIPGAAALPRTRVGFYAR